MTVLGADVDRPRATTVIAIERLLWAGPLTVSASIALVLAVRLVVVQIPGVRTDSVSLGWIAPTVDTAILCTLAVIVFASLGLSSDDPLRAWRRVAFAALLVSFTPLLVIGGIGLRSSVPTALALMTMHVAAYVPCVTLLPRLTILRSVP